MTDAEFEEVDGLIKYIVRKDIKKLCVGGSQRPLIDDKYQDLWQKALELYPKYNKDKETLSTFLWKFLHNRGIERASFYNYPLHIPRDGYKKIIKAIEESETHIFREVSGLRVPLIRELEYILSTEDKDIPEMDPADREELYRQLPAAVEKLPIKFRNVMRGILAGEPWEVAAKRSWVQHTSIFKYRPLMLRMLRQILLGRKVEKWKGEPWSNKQNKNNNRRSEKRNDPMVIVEEYPSPACGPKLLELMTSKD